MPAVPDLDLARIQKYCDERVPERLRDEIRIEVNVRGKSVTILECRPPWRPDLTDWSRVRVAQLRYNPTDQRWTLYWADRNSRWHLYHLIEPDTVNELLSEIEKDPTCIFWG